MVGRWVTDLINILIHVNKCSVTADSKNTVCGHVGEAVKTCSVKYVLRFPRSMCCKILYCLRGSLNCSLASTENFHSSFYLLSIWLPSPFLFSSSLPWVLFLFTRYQQSHLNALEFLLIILWYWGTMIFILLHTQSWKNCVDKCSYAPIQIWQNLH